MIKRIIFDIDNTLIKWEDSYYGNLGVVFDALNMQYKQIDIDNVIYAINEYEKRETYFQKEAMHKIIEEKLQRQIPNNFVDTMLTYFSNCVPEKLPEEIIETLEYLSTRYELVTLTNWFEETQKIRLEKTKINKYFKKIYACEKIKIKPNKESYLTAIGNHRPEECLMIGDNIIADIQGAQKCNLQVLYYNPKVLPSQYKSIQRINELKEIL